MPRFPIGRPGMPLRLRPLHLAALPLATLPLATLLLAALLLAVLLLDGAGVPAAADDVPVDLELVLAVDVSGSIDTEEAALQRRGYLAALVYPDVVRAIRGGPFGRIAVKIGRAHV